MPPDDKCDLPSLRRECSSKPQEEREQCILKAKQSRGCLNEAEDLKLRQLNHWNDNDYFQEHKRGNYTQKESEARVKVLGKGVTVFRDVGLSFYKVCNGDTKDKIREKLVKYKEFEYIKDMPENRLSSLNISDASLRRNEHMWIPIPIPEEVRQLSEKDYVSYWEKGIEELKTHPYYGKTVEKLIKKVGIDEILKLMIAVAKVESGGAPIGQYEFHRYEPHHQAFSFSIFHVLMKGPGLMARRRLNLTEGQTYHPKNAGKLFLAFLIQKAGDPSKYFPLLNGKKVDVRVRTSVVKKGKRRNVWTNINIDENLSNFSSFYNGKGWKRNNVRYPFVLETYLKYAETVLKDYRKSVPKKPPVVPKPPIVAKPPVTPAKKIPVSPTKPPVAPAKPPVVTTKPPIVAKPKIETAKLWPTSEVVLRRVGKKLLAKAVEDANSVNSTRSGISSILKTDENVQKCVSRIVSFLKSMYGSDTYYPYDRIGVGVDKKGTFIIFKRGFEEHILRVEL